VQTSGPAAGTSRAPTPTSTANGEERYGTPTPKPLPTVTSATPPPPKPEKPLEQDPPNAVVPEGTKCKRLACNHIFSPSDDPRSDEECTFHPGVPIFHEGSKGYSCCKRRVLEFDQFLKIVGCTRNRHLYLGAPKSQEEEELVDCRNDFYQTYTNVIVSIFAKKVDKETAKVEFKEKELLVDLPMPAKKRFTVVYPLYAAVVPEECTAKILGTKVEINLKKGELLDDLAPRGGFMLTGVRNSRRDQLADFEKRRGDQ
jgi:hypothetical protein